MVERKAALPRADSARRGILMMVIATALWSAHDAASKWLTEEYSIFQILFLRSLFALFPILLLVHREGGLAQLRTRRLAALLGRGCLGATAFGLFLAALPLMPLASAYAIAMSAPLLITALSVPLLGERVGPRRWAAVLVGFAAVLLMIRPEAGDGWTGGEIPLVGAGILLVAMLFYALGMMATRALGRTESAARMTFYASLVFLAAGAATAPFVWVTPSLGDLALFAAVGLLAGLAQYCMTQAFRIAPPATVAPFEYSAMVWAVIFGFLIWGDLPGWQVSVGSAVIVLSGLYVLHRETAAERAE